MIPLEALSSGLGSAEGANPSSSSLAAALSAVTKPFGVHGIFYRVAGRQAAAIDGPTSYTIPPYNQSATLGPRDPDGAARALAAAIGGPVAVIDANDAGGAAIGFDLLGIERIVASPVPTGHGTG